MTTPASQTCCAAVSDFTGFHWLACGRRAKYNEGGKYYCGTHAPSRKAAIAAKRGPTLYERECAAREKAAKELADLKAKAATVDSLVGLLREARDGWLATLAGKPVRCADETFFRIDSAVGDKK